MAEKGMWPVYGHNTAVHLLQRTLPSPLADNSSQRGFGGPRHAYLLVGAQGIGKSTLAQVYAQALLCTEPSDRPCGVCRSCRLIRSGNHPDFRLVAPVDREGAVDRSAGLLRVEQAATIIRDSILSPLEGRYKIFLLQDMQQANESFANKLLKTLEEPPAHVILLLTATERTQLLPTIVSRCQVIEMQPIAPTVIEQALGQHWQAEPKQAQLLARLAGGRLGWAVTQLHNAKFDAERQEQLEALWRLAAANRIQRLAFSEQTAAKGSQPQLFNMLELWTTWWRDVLLAQANCIDACSNIDLREEIARQAAHLSQETVQKYIQTLKRIEGYLHHTTNTRMALDVLLLQLPRIV
ncbi:MAG: DNA polymerase III subunit delta' [Caldilineaceae bacterium]|nr:DNA polymerase III subunit delta' [Caldilineaceae bacterium]